MILLSGSLVLYYYTVYYYYYCYYCEFVENSLLHELAKLFLCLAPATRSNQQSLPIKHEIYRFPAITKSRSVLHTACCLTSGNETEHLAAALSNSYFLCVNLIFIQELVRHFTQEHLAGCIRAQASNSCFLCKYWTLNIWDSNEWDWKTWVHEDKASVTGTAIKYCKKMANFQTTPWYYA
jgi:hypothetical protein